MGIMEIKFKMTVKATGEDHKTFGLFDMSCITNKDSSVTLGGPASSIGRGDVEARLFTGLVTKNDPNWAVQLPEVQLYEGDVFKCLLKRFLNTAPQEMELAVYFHQGDFMATTLDHDAFSLGGAVTYAQLFEVVGNIYQPKYQDYLAVIESQKGFAATL